MDGHGCQLQCDLCACGDGGAVLGMMDMATGSGDNMCAKAAPVIDYRTLIAQQVKHLRAQEPEKA